MAEPKTIHLEDLELRLTYLAETDVEVSAGWPFSSAFSPSTDLELEGGHTVVYFEREPGKELGTHEASPEELVICLAGDGIAAWAGDAEGTVGAGDLLANPPMAPHGFRNTGDGTARCPGISSGSTVVGGSEEVVQSIASRVVKA